MSDKTKELMTYREYLESNQWDGLRSQAKARAGGRCEKCGAEAKQVHHIKYPNNLSNDGLENLQALCRVCHRAAHLEQKARKLSNQLAGETDKSKIYLQLMAWGVEYFKYSRG